MKEKIAQLEKLVATATNPRQRTMYQKLLEKAQEQRQMDSAAILIQEHSLASSTTPTLEKQKNSTHEKLSPEGSIKPSTEETESKTTEPLKTNLALSGEEKQNQRATNKQSQSSAEITKEETTTVNAEKSKTPSAIFQAVGVIEGIVSIEENGKVTITIEGQKYSLGYVTHSKKKNYQELVEQLKVEKNLKRKLSVYPHYNHQGEKGKLKSRDAFGQKAYPIDLLSFNLVSVEKKEKRGAIFTELEPGEFKIAGFWQHIPYCETPCVTILRNYQPSLAKIVKQMDKKKALVLLQANHLSVMWSKASYEPFKYDEELSKKKQMPRYFVQLKVKLKGESGLFEVVEETGIATTTAPRYLKYKG